MICYSVGEALKYRETSPVVSTSECPLTYSQIDMLLWLALQRSHPVQYYIEPKKSTETV